MAEALVFLQIAANKLQLILSDEGRLLGGLRREVQLISDEFGHMKAFLQKVAGFKEEEDPQLSEWIRQVREASYDTEDVVDEFNLLFARHRPRGFRGSIQWNLNSIRNLPARHQLASKLQSLKARIINISESRLRYESHYGNIPAEVPWSVAENNRLRHSKDDDALLAEEAQLVGINKPKKRLISELLQGNYQLKVISMLGMGGLGKTTLAKKVHDAAAVKNHFQIRVWVTVSQNCDVQELLKGLIQEVQAHFEEPVLQPMDFMNIYQLKALLKDFLHRARYMIVFDDVWDMEFWDAFKFVLPENSYGGNRALLTTRIADVASASCIEEHDYIYKMRCLNAQDSWTLFCRKTFKDNHCPTHLKNVVKSIVQKCEGLPLAIVAIGGLLGSKDLRRLDEWELIQRSLGDEFEGTGKLDRVKKILSLSYDDLRPTLKACLLYTSIYPYDYKIQCSHLINLWVAERFAEPRGALTAEEVAWDYLKELVNRSLIQVGQVRYNGLYKSMHIHDLLREFIANKSREQNMATIVSRTQKTRTGWPPKKVVRRLVFDNIPVENITPESHHYVNNLRSIIRFGKEDSLSKALLTEILSSKFLKVVNLSGVKLEEIPEEIFNLFQLTHLDLEGTGVRTVPKSIRRLENLEYLNLAYTNVRELPDDIIELQKVRHLWVYQQGDSSKRGSGCNGFKAPCKLGELLELKTLWMIDAAESEKTRIVNEIGKLTKLRKLRIKNLRREDGKELCRSIEKLTNLQRLVVSSVVKDEVVILDLNHPVSDSSLQAVGWLKLKGRLVKMPPWIKNLQGLQRITLSLSTLLDDPLEPLQHLPNLSEVWLMEEAYQGESLCFKAGGFLMLKKLSLLNMKGLRWIRAEEGAMPRITKLRMEDLPLLEDLPSGIEHLRKLQKLALWDMSSQLTSKLENAADSGEENEDSRKISHVAQVIIRFQIDGKWKSRRLSPKKKAQVKKKAQHKQAVDADPLAGRGFGILLFALAVVCVVVAIVLLAPTSSSLLSPFV